MAIGKTKDLTSGKAMPLLLGFSVPILLGQVLQQFYQLTDSAIVSQYLGVTRLAAVGASTSITFLILGFCNGCSGGMAIPVAQAFGARDYRALRKYVFNSLRVTALLSIILASISVALCPSIIRWIKVPFEISRHACIYLSIILGGIPCTFYYNLLSSIIRALGDSKTPFLFLLFSSVLNIALDLLFITVFSWGIAGAAVATVFSQGLSAMLCFRFMKEHYELLWESREDRAWDGETVKALLKVGAPMGFQFSITAIGSIMLQSANNALGTVYVAAFAAGIRIKMVFMVVLESFGMAMATFCGQNYGAGKTERIKDGVRASLVLIVAYSALAFAVMWPCSRAFARIFAPADDVEIIAATMKYIRVSVSAFILLGTLCLFRYSIQGLGYTNFAMWSGVMEMIARVFVAFVMVAPLGYTAVCFGDAIAWVLANAFLVPAFIHVYRKVSREV